MTTAEIKDTTRMALANFSEKPNAKNLATLLGAASETNGYEFQTSGALDLRTLIEGQSDIVLRENGGVKKVVVGREIWLEGAAETPDGDGIAIRLTGDVQLLKDVAAAVIAARGRLD